MIDPVAGPDSIDRSGLLIESQQNHSPRSETSKAALGNKPEHAVDLDTGVIVAAPIWLRGRENVHKRYLVHVAGYNLGILMRALFGAGTPREAAAIRNAFVFLIQTAETIVFVILATSEAETAALMVALSYEASP